ncbi:hypothetical protein A1O3_10076 [Capronia epimyces CBS 606.96]|uniref:FAD-binding FR-type domain-containing protein n=1 Tax=Capronia epimyces CBS 606.96 TaxID=1182542 RepID=W9Y399_9EURO|nr:uncharacterized protein A1O3_10076 [Capronia epimyces CBS 606.96]EXJ76919.1 hypothetical protein A1O3_10076 [Capronia epimyces CBS 606.96]
MYKPVCCYACHDSLSSLYLNCTTFVPSDDGDSDGTDMKIKIKLRKRMDMGGGDETEIATTTDECRSSNPAWLQTFACCVSDRCTQAGVSADRQDQCFADLAAGGLVVPSLREALPQQAPVDEVAEDAGWLNTTSLVNSKLWATNENTLAKFEYSEDMHTTYSLVVWLVTIGVCVAVSGYTFIARHIFLQLPLPRQVSRARVIVIRKIRQHLLLPALFRSRHLSPLPYNVGYLPGRALSLFIALYVTLNIIFCCVSYPLASPNSWYSTDRDQVAAYVGNRTGVLSFANLALAILFAGRNNLLISLTGWSQTTFLTLHRWASRVATVQAVVHSIIYTVTYFWDGGAAAYYAEAAQAYYWWGIIATVSLALMVGLTVLPIRLALYELFLVTHIILAILALVGCWYHIDLRFSKNWGYEVWLYLCFAFWAFDRLARIVRVALFNRWDWIGLGLIKGRGGNIAPSAEVERIPNTDIVQLTLFPGRWWASAIRPGMHTFLYFPMSAKFWESHPFTIADWGFMNDENENEDEKECGTQSHGRAGPVLISDKNIGEVKVVAGKSKSTTKLTIQHTGERRFYLRFLLRVRNGSTRSLLNTLTPTPVHVEGGQVTLSRDSSRPVPRPSHQVLTEGPYAGHMQTLSTLVTADTVLCIAGGIGVTFTLGFIKEYLTSALQGSGSSDEGPCIEPIPDIGIESMSGSGRTGRRLMQRTTRFVVAWSAREEGLIRSVEGLIRSVEAMLDATVAQLEDQQLSSRRIEFNVWLTGEGKGGTKPDGQRQREPDEGDGGAERQREVERERHGHRDIQGEKAPPSKPYTSTTTTITKTVTRSNPMPIADVIASTLEVGRRTAVLVCAPGGMADVARRCVVDATGRGFNVDLVEEAFAW